MSILRVQQGHLRGIVGICQRYLNVTTIKCDDYQSYRQFVGAEPQLWVPQEKLGRLIGKGGTMIQALQQETGTAIHLDNDGMQDGLVPVSINGLARRCTLARKRIEELIADLPETTIQVPKEKIGLVIGKGGAMIKAMQQDTGAYINIDSSTTDEMIPVTIKGKAEQCSAAKERIEALITDGLQMTVWVPQDKAGFVIGKGGSMIQSLQKDTGTQIDIDSDLMKDGLIPVTIKGWPDKCAVVKARIELLVTDPADLSEKTIWIPETMVGMIIGKAGANLRSLRQDTNTMIYLDADSKKDGLVPVTIKGLPKSCDSAVEIIKKKVHFKEITVLIPEDKTGWVIGRQGETINRIKNESGCSDINVDGDSAKDGSVSVVIRGSEEECAAASELISEVLDYKYNSSME